MDYNRARTRAFFFGLPPKLENIPFLKTEKLYEQSGQNTGNLAISFAIQKTIENISNSIGWEEDCDWFHDPEAIGVMALSNQLGPHANMGGLSKKSATFSCGLVGIGLGAQANSLEHEIEVPSGSLEWIHEILARSPSSYPNISLRGEFTRRILEKHGLADKTKILGCPTLFISPDPNLGATIANRFKQTRTGRILVTAGHNRWQHLGQLERSLTRIVDRTDGAYICQSPLQMVRLGRGEVEHLPEPELEECRSYINPWKPTQVFKEWTFKRCFSFFSVSAWLEYLRRFDFVVGTRIHGVILGMQIGIPALCITSDSRTEELCRTMKIPNISAKEFSSGISLRELDSLFQFDPISFDQNRKKLAADYVEFIKSNRLLPTSHLKLLA